MILSLSNTQSKIRQRLQEVKVHLSEADESEMDVLRDERGLLPCDPGARDQLVPRRFRRLHRRRRPRSTLDQLRFEQPAMVV